MRSCHHYNGQTVFGYINGTLGSVYVRARDHSTGTTSSAATIETNYQVDDHASPCVIVRESDHRVLVYKSKHNGTNVQQHISVDGGTSLTDTIASGFTVGNLDSQLGGANYTYVNVIQLTGEAGDPAYLFVRPDPGGSGHADQYWSYSKSTNFGTSGATPTWSSLTKLFQFAGRGPYPQILRTSSTRIDLVVADGHWTTETDISIWHAYYDASDTSWHATDGTTLTLPLSDANMTLVHDGSGELNRASDVILDGSGHPWILWRKQVSSTDFRYMLGRWDGSAWDTPVEVESTADDGGACFDHSGTGTTIYCAVDVSGTREMFKQVTADGGDTWTPTAITTSSSGDNLNPQAITDAGSGMKVLWLYGTHTGFTTWNVGTRGY